MVHLKYFEERATVQINTDSDEAKNLIQRVIIKTYNAERAQFGLSSLIKSATNPEVTLMTSKCSDVTV